MDYDVLGALRKDSERVPGVGCEVRIDTWRCVQNAKWIGLATVQVNAIYCGDCKEVLHQHIPDNS